MAIYSLAPYTRRVCTVSLDQLLKGVYFSTVVIQPLLSLYACYILGCHHIVVANSPLGIS